MNKWDLHNSPIFNMIKSGLDCFQGNIMITDGDANIIFANRYFCETYHLTFEEAMTMKIHDLIGRGIINRSAALAAYESKEVSYTRLTTNTGHHLDCVGYPILDESGELICVAAYSFDGYFMKELMAQIIMEQQTNARFRQTIQYLSGNKIQRESVVADEKTIEIYNMAKIIAKSNGAAMIYGESGTGKELLANYIHENSERSNEVFVPINCGAIPNELLESEFFGYVKGAFTGADRNGKMGLLEMANKGTVFLDEIGDFPRHMQAKLLRFLETGEVKRVGSNDTIYVDVRIISATNKDLKAMVHANEFREDLYYRLNVIPFTIPPLRERPKDIEAIAALFAAEFNQKYSSRIMMEPELIKRLKSYDWPGNVRELRNEMERMAICSMDSTGVISASPMFSNEGFQAVPMLDKNARHMPLKEMINDYEKQVIRTVIGICDGKIPQAAEKLGVHKTVLYKKMQKYGLEY